MITRRLFVRNAGITLFGFGTVPRFLYRTAMAAPPTGRRRKTLVTLFLRGGMDGLNAVVPFGEKAYYASRKSIAIPAPSKRRADSAIDLDGRFGLHPSLAPLTSLYQRGHLAILNSVGLPRATRSHFDAQDFVESATPYDKNTPDGWLNCYLVEQADPKATAFRGISMGKNLPRSLKGSADAIALGNMADFQLRAGRATQAARSGYQSLYDSDADALLSGTANEMFEAIDFLKKANPAQYRPAPSADYPGGPLGRDLRELAQLLKANIGIEVAFVDLGGWDHHFNQGAAAGRMARLLNQLSKGLAAFYTDLGDRMEDITVLALSEFGRTVRENGSGGTDHGHGNVMLALGGSLRGGRIYGRWPGLEPEQLFEGRDLASTTDYRDVFAELLTQHLGCGDVGGVFPEYAVDRSRFMGFVKA